MIREVIGVVIRVVIGAVIEVFIRVVIGVVIGVGIREVIEAVIAASSDQNSDWNGDQSSDWNGDKGEVIGAVIEVFIREVIGMGIKWSDDQNNDRNIDQGRDQTVRCKRPIQLKSFRNGYFTIDNEKLEFGTTITFFCNENYELTKADAITCNENGKWLPRRLPRCRRLSCGNPGRPEDGRRFGSNFTVGANVSYRCNGGYTLVGSAIRTCQSNGLWSGELVICLDKKSHCPNPGVPANGRRIGKSFEKGDVVVYECLPGFTLIGDKSHNCTLHGNWTGNRPFCEDDNKVTIPPIEETALLFSNDLIKPLAKKTCQTDENGKCIKSRGRSLSLNNPDGLDLIFLIDSSSSIGQKNFDLTLEFICEIIVKFGVDYGKGGTRVAAVTFSTKAYLVYNLGDASVDTATRACEITRNIKYRGGGTGIAVGMDLVRTNILSEKERNRKRALILITDGTHNFGGSPIDIARKLKSEQNVEIYTIGVGKKIKRSELKNIASRSKKTGRKLIFQLKSEEDFQTLLHKIIRTDYSLCGIGPSLSTGRGRVSQGKDADDSGWPWQVAIYRSNVKADAYSLICGGSIINKTAILTAAHCLEEDDRRSINFTVVRDPHRYRVVVGHTEIKLKDKDWVTKNGLVIKDIYVHPLFEFGEKHFNDYNDDIAIFQLREPVRFSRKIRSICLPKPSDHLEDGLERNARQLGYVTGWGLVNSNKDREEKLQFADLYVNSNETCKDEHFVKEKMFCVGNKDGKDACRGDSGGPFSMYFHSERVYKLVGMVSWGDPECGGTDLHGYLTRVTNYLSWIKEVLKEFT
eukprot:gene10617-19356_t